MPQKMNANGIAYPEIAQHLLEIARQLMDRGSPFDLIAAYKVLEILDDKYLDLLVKRNLGVVGARLADMNLLDILKPSTDTKATKLLNALKKAPRHRSRL